MSIRQLILPMRCAILPMRFPSVMTAALGIFPDGLLSRAPEAVKSLS